MSKVAIVQMTSTANYDENLNKSPPEITFQFIFDKDCQAFGEDSPVLEPLADKSTYHVLFWAFADVVINIS